LRKPENSFGKKEKELAHFTWCAATRAKALSWKEKNGKEVIVASKGLRILV
jgi:hypothetical protein